MNHTPPAEPELMTAAEVSEYLRTPEGTLKFWRHAGTGPRYVRIGGRRVLYPRADLMAWVSEQYEDALTA